MIDLEWAPRRDMVAISSRMRCEMWLIQAARDQRTAGMAGLLAASSQDRGVNLVSSYAADA